MANPARIFISYSHQDDALRERLRTHLSQLERDGLVEAWDDRAIPAGDAWADAIDQRLEQADVVLLLVSADFIRSEYCYRKEMGRALARNADKSDRAIVIPVILHDCDWQTAPFAKLQALPRDAKPVEDYKSEAVYFAAVAKGLRKRIEGMVAPGQSWLTRIGARLRDPAWWQRPAVLAALLLLVAGLAASVGWWWQAAAQVQREIAQGTAMLRVGRYGDAQALLEPVCRRWLVGRPACFVRDKASLGALLESQGDTLPAEQFAQRLDALKARHPREDPDLLLFSGGLALQTRDPEQIRVRFENAVKAFRRAIELAPGFPEAYYYLGSVQLMSARGEGDYSRARALFDQAIAAAPNAPHYLNARAYARYRLGDLTGAEADYLQSADGGLNLSRIELAEVHWLSGRFAAAADQQRAAIEQLARADTKGRNNSPWAFDLAPGRRLVLRAKDEKACYARLAWQASQALLGREVEPDLAACGAHGSDIALAAAAGLERAMAAGLPAAAVPRAEAFAGRLRELATNSGER